MSWQDDAMIEQEQADALFDMGEAEWRDTFEDRHGWCPDYDCEVRKTNMDDVSYKYANPDVTKAFDILDGKEENGKRQK